MNGQAGVWSGPRSGARLRRVWSPAALSAFPIPAAVWRWIASSLQEKVGPTLAGLRPFWISPFVSCKCKAAWAALAVSVGKKLFSH